MKLAVLCTLLSCIYAVAGQAYVNTLVTALANIPGDVKVSPDGSRVAVALDIGFIRLYSASGAFLSTNLGQLPVSFLRIAFHPSGNYIASLSDDGISPIVLYEIGPGGTSLTVAAETSALFLTFSGMKTMLYHPSGTTLFVADIFAVHVFTAGLARITTINGNQHGNIFGMAVSSNGLHIVLTIEAAGVCRLTIWSALPPYAFIRIASAPGMCAHVAYSPDNSLLATGDSLFINLWNTTTLTVIAPLTFAVPEPTVTISFSRDGSLIMGGSSTKLTVWNVATRARLFTSGNAPVSTRKDLGITQDTLYLYVRCWFARSLV